MVARVSMNAFHDAPAASTAGPDPMPKTTLKKHTP
jgi:hypothetical protein